MIILNVTYVFECEEDREEFFENLYTYNIPDTFKAENGNIMYDYYFPAENDNELLLIEKWEDEASLDAHTAGETFKVLQELKAKFAKDTRIEKYTA